MNEAALVRRLRLVWAFASGSSLAKISGFSTEWFRLSCGVTPIKTNNPRQRTKQMKTRHPPPAPPRFSAQCGAAILLLATSLFLSGCSTIDKLRAPALAGDPSTSSVVVVQCESTWQGALAIKTPQRVVSGAILSIVGPQQVKHVDGSGVAGLIIFSDVAPGEYNLARIETTREVYNQGTWHETYNIPGESVTNYIFSVKAGEPKYLGVVTVEETQKLKRRVDFGLKPGKQAEIAAWEKFISLYPGSSWANAVQKRISELKQ